MKKANYTFWTAAYTVCILMAVFISSCKSTKTIQTAIYKKDTAQAVTIREGIDSARVIEQILGKIKKRHIDYKTFSAKIKVDYTDKEGKNNNATAFVKLKKDSLLWVSLTGTLGIEGFRVLVSPDSVLVMDKLEKTYTRRSISSLQELTNLPLDFAALQDLIIGNPVYFSERIISYKSEASVITALSIGEYFKHVLSMDTTTNAIAFSKIDDMESGRNRTCFISYSGYVPAQGTTFSTVREITVTEKTSLNIKLDYKQFAFDETLSFPFNIPKNYKQK